MMYIRWTAQVGLVDELAPMYKLQAAAEEAMQQMLKSPDGSRAVSMMWV